MNVVAHQPEVATPGHLVLIALVLLVLKSPVAGAEAPATTQPTALSAKLTAAVDGPLLAGFPLQFKLTITNTGPNPIFYWWGGGGEYPSARSFTVTVTNAGGTLRVLRLHNGQYEEGSGIDRKIVSEQTMPAACDPLPAGNYTMRVSGKSEGYRSQGRTIETWPALVAEPIEVVIATNAPALADAEDALKDRAREKEPFAHHVSEVYGIDPAVKRWLDDLLDDDTRVPREAIGRLQSVRRLPPGGDEILRQAAEHCCHPKIGAPDRIVLRYISLIARHAGTDAALEATLTIIAADVDIDAREGAVSDLSEFPQPKAEETLLSLAKEADSPVYWAAIRALAGKHNSAALAPLMHLRNDPIPGRRSFALNCLGAFRDNPDAHAALVAGLADPDASVRWFAQRALDGIGGKTEDPY